MSDDGDRRPAQVKAKGPLHTRHRALVYSPNWSTTHFAKGHTLLVCVRKGF